MKKILLMLLIASVSLTTVGCGEEKNSQTDKTTTTITEEVGNDEDNAVINSEFTQQYSNETYGFTLRYPENWSNLAVEGTISAFVIDEITGANMNIVSESSVGYDLEQYNELAMKVVKDLYGIANIESKSEKLGNYDVISNVYDMETAGVLFKFCQVYLIEDDEVYIFSYTCPESTFDEGISEFKQVISTIEFE